MNVNSFIREDLCAFSLLKIFIQYLHSGIYQKLVN